MPQVLDGWLASGFPLKPLPEYERPARYINPALLRQTRSLSALVEAAQPNAFALCVMIAHSPEPLDFDMSLEALQSVPQPQLAAFFNVERQPPWPVATTILAGGADRRAGLPAWRSAPPAKMILG
ncbi:hypothetical protein [Roseinatronobacter monicus]|uniref:Uncharacterized protein n=1 Tax=Roseinatronobacter monicus TaxID=393481 RepID=A0A543KG74_9RHOB|nr:hypothetical protein [Roseinatronobacter monicus]TQM94075.1 hypothetical protein BD293_2732 [Roseinatronobacter monicus]